jgi:ABC-type antimicrobial peptide transport system permease subunit
MLGVAGALTFATKLRAREIAVELVLGADPRRIRRRVVRQAMTAAAAASGRGLALGVGVGRLMFTALFGVGAADPTAIAFSTAVILLAAWGSVRSRLAPGD